MKLTAVLLASIAHAGVNRAERPSSKLDKAHEKFEEKKLVDDPNLQFGSEEYDHKFIDDALDDYTDDDFENYDNNGEFRSVDDLSTDEVQNKLGFLASKMDKDGDGKITQEELTMWIHYVQTKYIYDDTERQWSENDVNGDGKITWDEYKEHTYGFLTEEELSREEEDGFSYEQMLFRDERRWKQADNSAKGYLIKEELTAFLHPEEYDHMKDMVIVETIEDIDKDKDGKISLQEYIGDMWHEEDEGDEPDWVEEERRQFHEFRDKDKSGFLENDEVRDWILPSEYDHAEGEARHLIESCDIDQDGILTKEEILKNHDIFIGSQATDWGDAIVRHDEF